MFSSIIPQPDSSNRLSYRINCPQQSIQKHSLLASSSQNCNLLTVFNKTQHKSSREFVRRILQLLHADRRTYIQVWLKYAVNMPIITVNGNLLQIWSVAKNVHTNLQSPKNIQRCHNICTHRLGQPLQTHTTSCVTHNAKEWKSNVWQHYTTSNVC